MICDKSRDILRKRRVICRLRASDVKVSERHKSLSEDRSNYLGDETMEKAIALLEVQAMVTAIVGLDAMVKTADVKLIHVEKRLGGRLVTVVVEGTVSAVTAALEAGVEAAQAVGNVMCKEVIARPHPDIIKFIKSDKGV